ncbi:MAG: YgiT-type zinc finger protein [Bryobacteraceae bacterium]
MKCLNCSGELEWKTAPFRTGGGRAALDNVPAWVCNQCGEAMFEEREVEAIQRTLADPPVRLCS